MSNVLRKTGWVLGAFVLFDIVGVGLSLVLDLVALVDRHWESSAALGYVIWFVMGVFCAACIYGQTVTDDWESAAGRRAGTLATALTAVVALALGLLSSLVWAGGEFAEPVAPDHRGVTLTYLVTTVLAVGLARFALFREATAESGGSTRARLVSVVAPSTRALNAQARETELFVPKRASRRSPIPGLLPGQKKRDGDAEDFRPSGFWGTVGFVLGVPVLLFLDVAFFLLAPFDRFDPWIDTLLTGALLGGVVWGFAAARSERARLLLVLVHAPLFFGGLSYLFAVLVGGLLVGFGVPDGVAVFVTQAGFWLGFAFGGWLLVAALPAVFERAAPEAGKEST